MRRTIVGLPQWQFLKEEPWQELADQIKELLPLMEPEEISSLLREYGYTTDWQKAGQSRGETNKAGLNMQPSATWKCPGCNVYRSSTQRSCDECGTRRPTK